MPQEFSPRVKAGMRAHRERLDYIDNHFRDDSEYAMEDALKAADAITFSPSNIELAAQTLWNASAPVKAGARPRWSEVKNDPDWARAVAATRNDAKIVAGVLWLSNDQQDLD